MNPLRYFKFKAGAPDVEVIKNEMMKITDVPLFCDSMKVNNLNELAEERIGTKIGVSAAAYFKVIKGDRMPYEIYLNYVNDNEIMTSLKSSFVSHYFVSVLVQVLYDLGGESNTGLAVPEMAYSSFKVASKRDDFVA